MMEILDTKKGPARLVLHQLLAGPLCLKGHMEPSVMF